MENNQPNKPNWIALFATTLGLVAACFSPILFIRAFEKAPQANPALVAPANPPPAAGEAGKQPVPIAIKTATAEPPSVAALSVMAFAGLVGLLAFLSLSTFIIGSLGLADKKQAMGLPEGSIRAVIALSLIVIFVIASLFLFGRLSEGQTVVIQGLTSEQVAQIPGPEIINKMADPAADGTKPTFTIIRQIGPTKASEDFGRQLLTSLSTLVVAVASFYFGAKSVKSAQSVIEAIAKKQIAGGGTDNTSGTQGGTASEGGGDENKDPGKTGAATDANQDTKPTGNASDEAKPPAEVAGSDLDKFRAKRLVLADLPASSGVLKRGADNKLELSGPGGVVITGPVALANIGEIDSNHRLSTATHVPIGSGKVFEPLFLVIHYTEGFSAKSSIEDWQHRTDGVLAHAIVDRDGTIFQCRPFNQICFHAGASRTRHPETNKLYESLNGYAIGIEIANVGDGGDSNLIGRLSQLFPKAKTVEARHRNAGVKGSNAAEHHRTHWETFPDAQTKAVFSLVRLLMKKYPTIVDITGHDCIAYERKTDPGPAFPMAALRQENGLPGLPAVWDGHGNKIDV